MRYILRIFLFQSLLTTVRTSHSSSHALLAADSTERYEYVVDEHGRVGSSSPSMMRRQGFEPKARRFMQRNARFKSLLQNQRQERMLRRREKLWNLEEEMENVHVKSSSYKPTCVQLSDFRLKVSDKARRLGSPHNQNIANCMAACTARKNIAHGGSTRSSGFKPANKPALALDGKSTTEFWSTQVNEPWWQVDLGKDFKIGEVWISGTNCNGCEVGLRDESCTEPTTSAASTTTASTTTASTATTSSTTKEGDGDASLYESKLEENDGEMALLEKLASQIKGHAAAKKCDLTYPCGNLDDDSNFVNCAGKTGQYLVIKKQGLKIIRISEVQVWEDALLSRNDAVAKMQPPEEDEASASQVLDGKADTSAISQEGDNPWLQIKLADGPEANSVGKISIYPGERSKFSPTADKPMVVGVSDKECTEAGCAKGGIFCGNLTASKVAGPYIVDCGGKNANFVWIEFPGKDRLINVATVEVEKSAECEQVVFEQKGSTKTCIFDIKYTGERSVKEEGTKYTSAVCHPAGKMGPIGIAGKGGSNGTQGAQGPAGKAGDKGDEGPEGAMGEQGDVGPEGPEGLEADVSGLATMGQLNIAGVLCVAVTIAVMVILVQKVAAAKISGAMNRAIGEVDEAKGEGEEAFEEGFEEGVEEAMPEEAEEQPA